MSTDRTELREVSEYEKVKALVKKDLTVRVLRTKGSFFLCALITIGVCWAIPLVYFAVDTWIWKVETEFKVPTWDSEGDGLEFSWVMDAAFGEEAYTEIRVKNEDFDAINAAWNSCNQQNEWLNGHWEDEDFSLEMLIEHRTTEDEDSHGYEPWYYADGALQVTSSIDYPQTSLSVWGGESFAGYKQLNVGGPMIQMDYFLKCLNTDGYSFLEFPMTYTNGNGVPESFANGDEVVAYFSPTDQGGVAGCAATYHTPGTEDHAGYMACKNMMYNWIETDIWTRESEQQRHLNLEMIQWDVAGWNKHYISCVYLLIPGFLWLFIYFMITAGFLMHVTQERNSGIKVIMMSMGLSPATYMFSQFVSYFIELSVTMFPSSIMIAAMVSDATGSSGMGFYVWLSLYISFMDTAPFLFCLAAFLRNKKQASALNNIFKFILPLTPAMVAIQYLNNEPAAIRFFTCMIPPLNFMFSVRDAIKDEITFEPIFCWFWNAFFWTSLAYYFDLTMASAADQGQKRHCFCYYDWKNAQIEKQSYQATELTTAGGSSTGGASKMLVVKDLKKTFGHFTAVNGMQLEIEKNTIYGLLGFNGAGKTTTINMITGILQPSEGQILIDGIDIAENINLVRAYLGMCPQHNVLYDMLTVEQHMYLFGRLRGMTDAQVDEQMSELLERLHMENQRETFAMNLSGGQKRMLCMVQAFLGDPKLVLLDEPTSGVDAESRRVMWDFIMEKKKDRVIILTTHQMREADVLCDIIGIMSAGKLLVEDTSVALKNDNAVGFTFFVNGEVDEISSIVDEQLPGAKVTEEQEMVKIMAPESLRNQLPAFLQSIESLPSSQGHKIGVQAATLESVFLNLAKNVERDSKPVSIKESVRGSGFLALGSQEEIKAEDEEKPPTLERSNTQGRLSGIKTGIDAFARPNDCMQLLYLLAKRMFINLTYWSPMIVAFCQVVVLAVLVNFLLTLLGSKGASATLKMSDPAVLYIYDDSNGQTLADDAFYAANFESFNPETAPLSSWEEQSGYGSRTKPEEQYVLYKYENGVSTMYLEPYWYAQGFAVINSINANVNETKLAGSAGNGLTSILSSLVAVLGIGLIISSTWHYIGKEIKEGLFEYQIQNGVKPYLLWFSHWVFDVGVNTVMICIFVAICWSGSGAQYTTDGVIWSGFCAMLPFVVIQYICIWWLQVDRVIEAVLTWSTFLCVGIWFGFLYWVSIKDGKAWDGDQIWTYLQKESTAWETNGKYKFALIVNYLLPPNQFMAGIITAVMLDVFKEDKEMFIDWDREFYSQRFWKTLLAAMFWGLVFLCMQMYVKYKPDPFAPAKEEDEAGSFSDVQQEAAFVNGLVEKKNVAGDVENGANGFPGIVAHKLTKVFTKNAGPFRACDDLSFHVNQGECFGLLGKNGAGKSTTMNMLTTVFEPSIGAGYLSGRTDTAGRREILGYCPQKDLFWEQLTVYQHLLYYGLLKGVPHSDIDDQIERLCTALTLDPYFSACTGNLSGGNKRKVMLATALIGKVEVLFLDECSTGVDPFSRKCMMDVIKAYKGERSVVLTTHMMEEVELICERVGIMVNGSFRCCGGIQDLIDQTSTGYQIEISTNHLKPENVNDVLAFVTENLKGATQTEQNNSLVVAFQVPVENNALSHVFAICNQIEDQFSCETVVSQMTMDQLFLNLTSDQKADDLQYGANQYFDVKYCCFGQCCCQEGGMCGCCCPR